MPLTDERIAEIFDSIDGHITGRLCRFARAIESEVCSAQNAIHAPQEDLQSAEATQQEPVAWALFADNGNIRIWTSAPDEVRKLALEQGLTLSPLYITTPLPAKVAEQAELINKCSEFLEFLWREVGMNDFAVEKWEELTEAIAAQKGGAA